MSTPAALTALAASGRARTAHHQHPAARPHWHVDYLRAVAEMVTVWYTCGEESVEHTWAACVAAIPGATAPMPRFGASDCRCESHLYYFAVRPSAIAVKRALSWATPLTYP